ncbi:MAG: hypothetical protein ACLRFR_03635 [Clostridia bacterium]
MKKIWEKGGATTAPNAGNPAARAQSADGALGGSSMPSSEKVVTIGKKNRKLLKVFAAGGLAFFMGVGTLCGVLIAPMGATSASNAGNLASAAQSADSALTPQEQLLAGTGLGLDPENDPVVYTTDYGLEIKYANALTNTALAGYTYFEAGGVNWVIIGYDSSVSEFVGSFTGVMGTGANVIQGGFNQFSTLDDTPAGLAIRKDMFAISSEAVPDEVIGDGCVLCLAAENVGETTFNPERGMGSNYQGSNLQSYINTYYDEHQDLKRLPIVAQTLTTRYCYGTTTITDAYLFPLAGWNAQESFYYGTYLQSQPKCSNATFWWLRSGSEGSSKADGAWALNAEGVIHYYNWVSLEFGVRPAFVLNVFG